MDLKLLTLRVKTTLICALLQEIFTIRCAKCRCARVPAAPICENFRLSGVNLCNYIISLPLTLHKEGE